MKPHIDIHMRITLSADAAREFSSPMEVAEHVAQLICSNSGLVNATVLPESACQDTELPPIFA